MALPVKYKEVVWLHYYEGYQTDEIAEMLCTARRQQYADNCETPAQN